MITRRNALYLGISTVAGICRAALSQTPDSLKKFAAARGLLYGASCRYFLADVASMGLKILVTEMDVTDQGLPYDYAIGDRRIADVYEEYLSVVLDESATIAVITWGLSDRYTWLSKHKPRGDGKPIRPLPIDANLEPKLAWHSMVRAFENRKL